MNLSQAILTKIESEHRGKESAIKRRNLLTYARIIEPDLTDRQLRNIYCQLPVASCDKGIFYPVTVAELEEYRDYLRKKAISLFERWQRVAEVHYNGRQLKLF